MKTRVILLIYFFCLIHFSFALTGARYLIVTPDSFSQNVQVLADWKTKKGVKAKVVPLSVTGNTAAQIKTYILNAYNNWDIRPEYVLLVGSSGVLPASGTSDDYYADMSGNYRIELSVGRFPCANVDKCKNIVTKTLIYERTPNISDTTWFVKGTTIVREDGTTNPDTVYWNNARYIHSLWQNAQYLQIDSFSYQRGHNSTNVSNAINDGRAFVVFRGQSVTNWWSPFAMTPENLTNIKKPTVVVSGTCQTMSLSDNSYLGNQFMNAGSSSTLKGAVGYFGTTVVASGSGLAKLRGTVAKGFFQAVFLENRLSMGDAAKRAKFIIDSIQPPNYITTRYSEWQLFGDPELRLWNGKLRLLTVVHDTVIEMRPQTFTVTVYRTGSPFANALVCVMMDTTVYQYGYTNSSGVVSFSISPLATGTMSLTITGQNCIPYEKNVRVRSPLPNNDVGVDTIIYPTILHYTNNPVIPTAIVKNYGSATQTNFPVVCSIIGTGNILRYVNTQYIIWLGAGETTRVNFANWIPNYIELCTVKIRTSLSGDQNLANNRKIRLTQINPTLTVFSPNGGEIWAGSSNQIIKWRATGIGFTHFRLLLSRNGGTTYSDTITRNIAPTETTYNWSVPNLNLNTCRIMVQILNAGNLVIQEDISDNNFTIDSELPSVPLLISPVNNTYIRDSMPRFFWHRSTDNFNIIDYYQLRYAVNLEFAGSVTINVTDTTYQVPNRLLDSTYYWQVRAVDRAGNQGNWSLVWCFEIDTRIPSIPTLISPIGGVWITNTTVVFNWSQVSFDALTSPIRYILQVDTTINFTTPTSDTISFVCDTLTLGQRHYYWRVRAYDLAGNQGAFSNNDSFGVDITAPNPPNLVRPINSGITNNFNVTFIWNRASDNLSGVAKYMLQYATNSNFINSSDTIVIDTTITRALTDTAYYWHVKALDNARNQSIWSTTFSFKIDTTVPVAPILISPTNGLWLRDTLVVFNWSQDDTLTVRYVMQVDTSAIFANPISDTTNLTCDTLVLSQDYYYWRVRTFDLAGNQSAFCECDSFGIDITAPSIPLLISPNNSAILGDSIITFIWQHSLDNLSGVQDYEIQIANNPNFTDLIDTLISDTSITQKLNDIIYWWRVRAIDRANNQSVFSICDSFWLDLYAPSVPNLVSPINEVIMNNVNVTFIWNHSLDNLSGVASYTLQYANNDSFINSNDTTIIDTTITLTLYDTIYYWRVRATDYVNNQSQWSTVYSFEIDTISPSVPILISPISGVWLTDTLVIFNWSSVSFANRSPIHYILQVATDTIWTNPISDTTSLTYDTLILNQGTYYWRVRAYDLAGNQSAFCSYDSFGIDNSAPTIPLLISPNNNAILTDSVVTFIWHNSFDSLSGVQNYEIQIAYDPNFTRLIDTLISDTVVTRNLSDTAYWWRVKAIDRASNESNWSDVRNLIIRTTGIQEQSNNFVTALYTLKPNPVTNSFTHFRFSIATPSKISLVIYDVTGKLIKTLLNENLTNGTYNYIWNGTGDNNRKVTEGIYFCTLKTHNAYFTKKLVFIR